MTFDMLVHVVAEFSGCGMKKWFEILENFTETDYHVI